MPEPHAQPHPSRRRVPRWVWFVVVCVALGAMTSVGVAWGIAWNVVLPLRAAQSWSVLKIKTASSLESDRPLMWGITERVGRGHSVTLVEVLYAKLFDDAGAKDLQDSTGLPPEIRRGLERHAPLLDTPEAARVHFTVRRWGWPLCCVAVEEACTAQNAYMLPQIEFADTSFDVQWRDLPKPVTSPAFNLRPHYHAIEVGDRLLPTFPLWPGLLANTAIYGGAWAVLIGVPVLLRRWLRARRGGCPHCGYSREGLKVDAPCPECGRTTIPATR